MATGVLPNSSLLPASPGAVTTCADSHSDYECCYTLLVSRVVARPGSLSPSSPIPAPSLSQGWLTIYLSHRVGQIVTWCAWAQVRVKRLSSCVFVMSSSANVSDSNYENKKYFFPWQN